MFCLKSFSQEKITVSKPFQVIDAAAKMYLNYGNSVISVKVDRSLITIQVFDSEKMVEVSRNEYKDLPKGSEFEGFFKFAGKYYFAFSQWDKPKQTEQLFAREIDPKDGTLNTNVITMLTYQGHLSVYGKFNFYFSSDTTKLLVQTRVKPEEKKDAISHDIIGFYVFGKDLELISDKLVKMPYTEKKMNNIDYSIDSKGNSYALTTVYDDNSTKVKKKGSEEANYHIEILKVNLGSDEVNIIPLTVKDKFIRTIWLYESPQKYMVCAGFYNNGDNYGDANGIFYFKLDKNDNIADVTSHEFSSEILNQYVSERTKKKNAKKDEEDQSEFSNLVLRNVNVQTDGSIVIVGEQYYYISYTTKNGTYYKYYYNDILIAKIDKSGALSWMKKLPKRQFGSKGQGGMGFKYFGGEKCHYLVYLDNVKNLNLPEDKIPVVHSDGAGGYLTAYKINDENGEVEKKSLFDLKEYKGMEFFQFTVRRIVDLSDNTFAIEFYKKDKQDVFVKVVFK